MESILTIIISVLNMHPLGPNNSTSRYLSQRNTGLCAQPHRDRGGRCNDACHSKPRKQLNVHQERTDQVYHGAAAWWITMHPEEGRALCADMERCSRYDILFSEYSRSLNNMGTSLVVQWLRLRAPNAGGPRFNPQSGN